jgi:hypothetical protein
MLKNMSGSYGILRTKKSHFCPKYLGTSWENPDAQKSLGILRIFILPKNFRHLMKVEENVQTFWDSEKILTLENFQAV